LLENTPKGLGMKLIAQVSRNGNGPRLPWMLELTMAPGLPGEIPAVLVQQPKQVAYLHAKLLAHRVLRQPRLPAVRRFAEVQPCRAVL
jgi:hypothetical protein